MIGLDSNVLIRYIVRDDEAQAKAATNLIEGYCTADAPGFVNVIVMCEIVWVLGTGYGYDRATVASVIREMLTSVELQIEESESVWQALRAFEAGGPDFADCLIGIHNKSRQAETTYTFDTAAAKTSGFTLVGDS